jgi:hypothetical protein
MGDRRKKQQFLLRQSVFKVSVENLGEYVPLSIILEGHGVCRVWARQERKPGRVEIELQSFSDQKIFMRTFHHGTQVIVMRREADKCSGCSLYSLVPWFKFCPGCEKRR